MIYQKPDVAHATPGTISVELFVRSLSPRGAQTSLDATVERLHALDRRGTIEGFSLTVWGDRLRRESADNTAVGRAVLDRIERFEAWADRHDLSSCFERRDVRSTITGDRHTDIVLPVLCIAVYENDRLGCVAPWMSADGDRTHTIEDCIDAIADPTAIDAHPPTTVLNGPTLER